MGAPCKPPKYFFLVFILISHCPYKYFDTNILKIEHKLSSWDFLKDPPPNKKYETVTGFRGISPLQTPQIIFLVFILINHCPYECFDTSILKIEPKLSSWDFLKDPPPNEKYETVTGFRGISPLQTSQIIFLVFILISHCPCKYLDPNILKIKHKLSS